MLWTISYWTTKYLTRNFQVFWLWETASWVSLPWLTWTIYKVMTKYVWILIFNTLTS
jgi:hypothetical protein